MSFIFSWTAQSRFAPLLRLSHQTGLLFVRSPSRPPRHRGQRTRFQYRIASSSRSSARPVGRWQGLCKLPHPANHRLPMDAQAPRYLTDGVEGELHIEVVPQCLASCRRGSDTK
jgi:hypothetical protein